MLLPVTIELPRIDTGGFTFGDRASRPDTAVFNVPLDKLNDIYIPHLNNLSRVQIFYGGSSSGKSVFLAQRDVIDILRGGRNFLVCRAVARTIRKSVFAEIQKVIADWGLTGRFHVHKSEMVITCDNGYQILFAGLDDTEKLKSITPEKGVITDVRIEEATEIEPDDIKQLMKRQRGGDAAIKKRLVMSFNPIVQTHHIYQTYFKPLAWSDDQTEYGDDRLSILKTWYIHNRFLTPDDIYDLENEPDEYYKEVYTFGNWGVLGDVIFTNWSIEDLSDRRHLFINHRNGLDFGFSNDPAALAQTHYDSKRKTVYVFGEFYEKGLTNDILADQVIMMIGNEEVFCDSSEPKSIAELKKYGVNAIGAAKGRDSVWYGIQWLKQQTIIIDKSCINTRSELQTYQWRKDKDGNSLRQPIDKNNHIIDGLRYAYERDMLAIGRPGSAKYA